MSLPTLQLVSTRIHEALSGNHQTIPAASSSPLTSLPPPSFNQNIPHFLAPLHQRLIRTSRQTHLRIDVETKNVGFLRSLSSCSICFNLFFCLGFLVWCVRCCGHYMWRFFLHPSIWSRCLQRIERERRRWGSHWWWSCRGGIWSCCWSTKEGKSKIILPPIKQPSNPEDGQIGWWLFHLHYFNRLCSFFSSESYIIGPFDL